MRENRPGIVQMELKNLEDKKKVLRTKSSLRDSDKYKRVYLKGGQTHAKHLNDLNFRTLLNEMQGGNRYRLTGAYIHVNYVTLLNHNTFYSKYSVNYYYIL